MKKLLFFFLVLLFVLPRAALGVSDNEELDLSVDPQKVMFDIRNVKPGDTLKREVNILNNGRNGFRYIISSIYNGGSEEFFNQLTIKIKDSNKIIFEGYLHDFEKIEPRLLLNNSFEKLTIYVTIPYQLNNKFQDSFCDFTLKFYVEGTLGGLLPVNGLKIPEPGTNMFNVMVSSVFLLPIGIILRKYYLRRKD